MAKCKLSPAERRQKRVSDFNNTRSMCYAAGRDAGNRSMRAGGRGVWNEEDVTAAMATFYRLAVVMGASTEVTHVLNLNLRTGAWFSELRQNTNVMVMAESANTRVLIGVKRDGFVYVFDSGNTESGSMKTHTSPAFHWPRLTMAL